MTSKEKITWYFIKCSLLMRKKCMEIIKENVQVYIRAERVNIQS